MLDLQSQRRHQTSHHHQGRREDHTSLPGPAVRDEAKQHDTQDLAHDQRVGDPRLVVRGVPLAVQVSEDDVVICCDLLLIAIGEVGSTLRNIRCQISYTHTLTMKLVEFPVGGK